MLRALWAGVSGMKAHQVGLDVTSNNIANVNTAGFKYSRANFSDMLYQTAQGASMPYGGRGGTNPYTVGLGGEVSSTTRIHTQGSLKTTNFQGDLALDGQGFFVLSGDGGVTRTYTRDGRFGFDALGNFVNNAGFVVQGWVKDITTIGRTAAINDNVVDTSGPVTPIRIDPKMVMPARATTAASIAANLTSGDRTDQLHFAYALDSNAHSTSSDMHVQYDSNGNRVQVAESFGTLFTSDGNAMKLQQDQGIWMSYLDAELKANINDAYISSATQTVTQSIVLNGQKISFVNNSTSTLVSTRDAAMRAINNATDKTGIRAYADGSSGIRLVNDNSMDGDSNTKNIAIGKVEPANGVFATFRDPANFDSQGGKVRGNSATGVIVRETSFRYKFTQQTNLQLTSANGRVFNTTEDLRRWIQYDANMMKNSHAAHIVVDAAGNAILSSAANPNIKISTYSIPPGQTGIAGTLPQWTETAANATNPAASSAWSRLNSVSVVMNQYGQFEIVNKNDGIKDDDPNAEVQQNQMAAPNNSNNLKITVANYQSRKTPSNVLFGRMMSGMQTGNLVEGGTASSTASFKVPKLTTSFDIYDSLGNKHLLQVEFRKKNSQEWTFSLKLPEPAEFVGASADMRNVLEGGSVTFGRNGQLQSVQPNRFNFFPRNGAAGPQQVDLDFGQNGVTDGFKGLTGTGLESDTTNAKQDGYTAGILKGWTFDANGVMMGAFTNGKQLALAQVALATFDNESGLDSIGGNLFLESPNSGQGVIGRANRAGNATVRAGKYEMSTADLSEELTQLIVIQRGYQANAKSVTTSDQVLNTLLGLKQ